MWEVVTPLKRVQRGALLYVFLHFVGAGGTGARKTFAQLCVGFAFCRNFCLPLKLCGLPLAENKAYKS